MPSPRTRRLMHDEETLQRLLQGWPLIHNLAFRGDYTPVLAKHSKRFSLENALSIGVDRMQRNFAPMRQQVERWREQQLSAEETKLTIYQAFIEGESEVPKHLSRRVYDLYFNPQPEEFAPRTTWSLSDAFYFGPQRTGPDSAI